EPVGAGGGHLDAVAGGGEGLAHLLGDQGRVVVDEQHVGHGWRPRGSEVRGHAASGRVALAELKPLLRGLVAAKNVALGHADRDMNPGAPGTGWQRPARLHPKFGTPTRLRGTSWPGRLVGPVGILFALRTSGSAWGAANLGRACDLRTAATVSPL